MKVISAFVLALLAAATACSPEPSETKDRLSPKAMEQMVEGPMAAVREDGLAAGDTKFHQLRAAEQTRSGPANVRVADLFMAYGVELYMEWTRTDDRALLLASRGRLHSAVSAYRAVFGPEHPEVAVALHSFADADIELNDGRATPQAQAALREALRIRRASLGPQNHETLATEDRLASIGISNAGVWENRDAAARALEEADQAARDSR